MFRLVSGLVLAAFVAAAPGSVAARTARAPRFVRSLDHNGILSAGWVQVLPALANSCNLRFDNQRLTARLFDLSREDGNLSYTRDLYTKLSLIERNRTRNEFVNAWMARFDGRQSEACALAESLWGDAGDQFPGVLKREASNDGLVAPGTAPNCK